MEVAISQDLGAGLGGITANIHGCKDCLAAALAILLLSNKDMKELINKAVRIANDRKAAKEN